MFLRGSLGGAGPWRAAVQSELGSQCFDHFEGICVLPLEREAHFAAAGFEAPLNCFFLIYIYIIIVMGRLRVPVGPVTPLRASTVADACDVYN